MNRSEKGIEQGIETNKQKPTEEEQREFDKIWKKVLLAVDVIVFNTPGSSEKFAEMLGGQEVVDKYHKMREELKINLKTSEELGINTKFN
jgi:hypothetical protein